MPINQPTAIFSFYQLKIIFVKSEASPTKASRISFSVITLENTIHLKQSIMYSSFLKFSKANIV
jgi:hypothetical protein